MLSQYFPKEIINHLTGSLFSNGLMIKYERLNEIYYRFNLLNQYLEGSKTIHVGCCDHLSLIDMKIKNNMWLHHFLTEICYDCLGVDINDEGINLLKNRYKVKNVICGNILSEDNKEIKSKRWDYILLAEVLEHINDPHTFLRGIWNNYHENVKQIIITVPNAFSLMNLKYLLKNAEIINSDHRYWFTPYTLAKIVQIAGFKIKEFNFCQPGKSPPRSFRDYLHPSSMVNDFLLRHWPVLGETILLVGKF